MATLTREQAKKSFYPYQANNCSQGVGLSDAITAGLLKIDGTYFTSDLIPSRTGFVYVVDRILISSVGAPANNTAPHDGVVTIRVSNGTTTNEMFFKSAREDVSGGDYHSYNIDWKVNGKLVLKEGYGLNAKISTASGFALGDAVVSVMVYGEYVQVEEARQRGLLEDRVIASMHTGTTNTTLVPKKDGKQFVIDAFYVVGLGATNAAIESMTLRFSSADDGSGTNYNIFRFSSRRSELSNLINFGTSDCHIGGPLSYGVTGIQTTTKKFSIVVIGRYVKEANVWDPTGTHIGVAPNPTTANGVVGKGERFWVYKTANSTTAALTPTNKPGYAIVEGYAFSGVRDATTALPAVSAFCLGYIAVDGITRVPISITSHAYENKDTHLLMDGIGVPILSAAELKGLVVPASPGVSAAWDQASVTIWGRYVSDKKAEYTIRGS